MESDTSIKAVDVLSVLFRQDIFVLCCVRNEILNSIKVVLLRTCPMTFGEAYFSIFEF